MTAEQLRNSILQEAISGRLVPQDPNEEPASVLLERIVAEQNKTLPPKKKKSVSLIAEPEDITPVSGWAYFYIKDLFDTTSGGTPIKGHPEYYDGDIPWVRSGELNSLYLYDSELHITEAGLKNSSAKYFPVDTVVIAMYGATIGKTSIFKRSMTTNQAICGIFPIDGILPEYIYYFLQNKKRDYCSIAFGSGQPNISQEKIKNTIFPLPPLAEQKRIVAKLEELLPIVEQYGKAQKELDELNTALPARLRQSILQEAILGRLVPHIANDGNVDTLLDEVGRIKEQMLLRKEIKKGSLVSIPIEDEEIEYSIPDSWRFVRLQDICTCIFSGKSPKYSQTPTKHKIIGQQSNQWTGVEMRYVKYGTDEYAKDIPQIQYLQDHDVLLNTLGNGTLGRSGIYYSSYSDTPVLTDGHIFVLRTPHEVTAKYILAYLRVKFVDINRSADGSTNQTFLNLSKTSKWIIPLPPLAEQQRIVAKIEELFTQIDKITK